GTPQPRRRRGRPARTPVHHRLPAGLVPSGEGGPRARQRAPVHQDPAAQLRDAAGRPRPARADAHRRARAGHRVRGEPARRPRRGPPHHRGNHRPRGRGKGRNGFVHRVAHSRYAPGRRPWL
ncbi:MAG: hypothetical protein AVDCRST_MAG89-3525, partial [uncultured Gemmatimonadetes bacterium]